MVSDVRSRSNGRSDTVMNRLEGQDQTRSAGDWPPVSRWSSLLKPENHLLFTDVGFNLCHFIIGALGNMVATDSIIIMIFMCVVFARGSASDKEMD